MPELIEISGNKVRYIRQEVLKEVGVEDFVAGIESSMGCDTGILPRGCLYMKKENNRCVYLIEVPAGLVPVTFKESDGRITNYMISIPFTQFYVACNPNAKTILAIKVTVTKAPLTSVEQDVFIAPYLNIFDQGNGNVCTGSMQIPQDVSLKMKVDATVSTFFEADFNADLTPQSFKPIGNFTNASSYIKKWAKLTAEDRFFSCAPSTEYVKRRENPARIIERMMVE